MFASLELAPGVVVREIRATDDSGLAAAYVKNREHLAPWDPIRPEAFYTAAGQAQVIAAQLREYSEGRTVPLLIEQDGAPAGRITLSQVVRGAYQSAALGYWIDNQLQGRGIVTAAVRGVVHYAFAELKLHRIEASTLLNNFASQTVLKRCGFTEFGMAPKFLNIAGTWQDHKLFQVLNEG